MHGENSLVDQNLSVAFAVFHRIGFAVERFSSEKRSIDERHSHASHGVADEIQKAISDSNAEQVSVVLQNDFADFRL